MAAFAVVLGGAAGAALYKLLKKPAPGAAASVPASSSPNGITAGTSTPATSEAVAQPIAGISTGTAPAATPCRACGGNPTMAVATPTLPTTRAPLPAPPAPQSPTSADAITAIVSGSPVGRPQAFASYY